MQTRRVSAAARSDFRNDTAKKRNKCAEPEPPKAGRAGARHALRAAGAAPRLAKAPAASRASTRRC